MSVLARSFFHPVYTSPPYRPSVHSLDMHVLFNSVSQLPERVSNTKVCAPVTSLATSSIHELRSVLGVIGFNGSFTVTMPRAGKGPAR